MICKTPVIAAAVICSLSAADLSSAAMWVFTGTWKLNLEKSNSPSAAKKIEFVQRGSDGLTVKIADLNAICEAKFDGKDYPATGPTIPSGYTLAVRRIDGRTFEMTQKLNGKTLYTSTFTASEDGSTLTENDSANAVGEKVKALYERQ
jgi:hypothetical protein